jgi:hypothetical protein
MMPSLAIGSSLAHCGMFVLDCGLDGAWAKTGEIAHASVSPRHKLVGRKYPMRRSPT